MTYPHQQKAIDYITNKLKPDPHVHALLLSGSIAHGFNNEKSDIDFNIIVSNELYEQKKINNNLTYWESAEGFYNGGYFDGKYITFDYLEMVAKRGNEPTRFAFQDVMILFDKTGRVMEYIEKIKTYDENRVRNNTIRFLSQFEAWYWYCKEALEKQNEYLLDVSVSKLILFSGRLILLENKMFFPYHKWFILALENAPKKPQGFMRTISELLKHKTKQNIDVLYHAIKEFKNWSNGKNINWSSHFVHDIETIWVRSEEYIENI